MNAYHRILPTAGGEEPTHRQSHGVSWSDHQLLREIPCRVQCIWAERKCKYPDYSYATVIQTAITDIMIPQDLCRQKQHQPRNRRKPQMA